MKRVAILLFLLGLAGCTSVPEGVTPVTGFESDRYLGTWYEIARFDHSFEEGLSRVTATYSKREDGGIRVLNKGYDAATGEWDEAEGKAYFVSDETTGHLKVSFFGPFYASYVIADLDKDNYQYSLVTGPDRSYLWILARQPTLSQDVLDELLSKAKSLGYATDEFIWVEHK
ncbi:MULTISPECIES: lipocalin family protein [Marisediminitalea]|jgi:apolipoprotein D and lipocalin family protein|uniref:lipocalin family protein n=1 Tax=Marisediminitalea TaxID=2662254 RepID=UPI0020CE2B9A|nr:lipocalin family protein [Marisediminitalea aggregata]MCP3865343.1 lipocalin [Aestuariibacter sp.]MCP4526300.1 lipocalin [Aestuariibacter sp.]MCP9477334.1 lipocalin family protein [Marisediminitalea aggregata]|tara:strand:- start:1776 stop:2291 length:516 start_codon:yes stop_codon:yes gene_type:complete